MLHIDCSGRKLSEYGYGENGWEEASKAQNAKAMAKFAAAMMRGLNEMDYEKFNLQKRPEFQLRYEKKVARGDKCLQDWDFNGEGDRGGGRRSEAPLRHLGGHRQCCRKDGLHWGGGDNIILPSIWDISRLKHPFYALVYAAKGPFVL